jgi:two-component system, NarL family, response regulator LiaR
MNSHNRISVLIVDDHAVVRQGIQSFLEAQDDIEVIGIAESGTKALQLAEKLAPDVALVDMVLPGMDGVEITRRLRQVSPRTQVIIFTSFHEDEFVFPAIRAGALSYLLKDVRPDEMAEAVRKAARGEAILDPKVASRLVQAIQNPPKDHSNPYTELSERELEVLLLIAEGLPNLMIAERLVISEKTVKSHVSNILNKLHLIDRTQAAVYAWSKGMVRKKGE